MRKIPTLLVRDPNDRAHVTDEVTPGCEWVLAGEGTARRKYDGTCVMLDEHGDWWARREVKRDRMPPPGWRLVETDPVTGKAMGWEPIAQSPFAKFHAEAVTPANEFGALIGARMPAGTYELVGPKINGNPEGAMYHQLERHATAEELVEVGTTVESIKAYVRWLAEDGVEGIVWHHPDGRMVKLKGRDLR